MQQFYDITRRELRELELGVLAKEKEMEVMEENHRVEVRVCVQWKRPCNANAAAAVAAGVRSESQAPGV